MTSSAKWFFKANNEVLSHCACDEAPAMSSGQLDCPWCGCGWLISCAKCHKAFTFAEVRETDIPLMTLAWAEVETRGITVTEEEIADWVQGMTEMLETFEVGDTIVYLDGSYWTLDSTNIHFEGHFAEHKLDRLPHADALADPPLLNRILGNADYWFERELPDRE